MASLALLEVVKACQQNNGLRHSDFKRYREYCSNRLRRLRKKLSFAAAEPQHGERAASEFSLRAVSAEEARADARLLEIPLMCAERCWSHAMELKEANSRGEEPRKRMHAVRRLKRAAQWAASLRDLCVAAGCEDRTALEAEAYAAWMSGNLLLELEQWKEALAGFAKAKGVYSQLAQVGSPHAAALCAERVEELEPQLRYCSYNLARESGPGASHEVALRLLREATPGAGAGSAADEMVQARVRKLLEAARAGDGSEGAGRVPWAGRVVPVRSEAVRSKLLALADQRALLSGTEADPQAAEAVYLEVLAVLDETARTVREELAKPSSGKQQQQAAKKEQVKVASQQTAQETADLQAYLRAAKLAVITQRGARLAAQLARACDEARPEPGKSQPVQPQEVVAMLDRALQGAAQLQEVFTAAQAAAWGANTLHEQDLTPARLAALEAALRARRAVYVAEWHARQSQWTQALALIDSAVEKTRAATAAADSAHERDMLEQIGRSARAHRSQLLAAAFEARLQGLAPITQPPLGPADVCALPPPLDVVPVDPVVFDLAFAELSVGDIAALASVQSGAQGARSPSSKPPAQQQSSGLLSKVTGWFGR